MEVNCLNCEEKIAHYLCDVPKKWKDQIVKAICLAIEADQDTGCDKISECGFTAILSAFYRSGTQIKIEYTNEHQETVIRSFDFEVLLNNSMDGIDPKCIATQEDWDAMNYLEKIQAIVDYDCQCCPND